MAQQSILIQNLVPGNRYSIIHRQGLIPTKVGTFVRLFQGQDSSARFNNLVGYPTPIRTSAFRDNEWFFVPLAAAPAAPPASRRGGKRKQKNTRKSRKSRKSMKSKRVRK